MTEPASELAALHRSGVMAAQAGRFDEAAEIFARVAKQTSQNADVHRDWGAALLYAGRAVDAVPVLQRAVELRPAFTQAMELLTGALAITGRFDQAIEVAHQRGKLEPSAIAPLRDLAGLLAEVGRHAEAAQALTELLRRQPGNPDLLNELGNALRQLNRMEEAAEAYASATQAAPDNPMIWANLAQTLASLNRNERAIDAYAEAIRFKPDFLDAMLSMASLLRQSRRFNEAVGVLNRAIAIKPDWALAHMRMGRVLTDAGDSQGAIQAARQALQLQPGDCESLCDLGIALIEAGQNDEAVDVLSHTLTLFPGNLLAASNLARALKELGRTDKSMELYRHGESLFGTDPMADSNRAFNVHYPFGVSPEEIFECHTGWNARHAAALTAQSFPHANSRDPDRILRIGYVSPDLVEHAVARFFRSLIANHDRSRFEIFCYANVQRPDATTRDFQSFSTAWRDVNFLSEEQIAAQVRADGIDILVDLAGHTGNNRLLVFARKPAPVQVTYLGYPDTTGLTAIDYRFTDELADPPGMTQQFCSEQLVRLPGCAWCYSPDVDAPPVAPLPAHANGFVTFGCFNAIAKVTDWTLALWAGLLKAVPSARLVLKSRSLNNASARERILRVMASQGIALDHVQLIEPVRSQVEHLRCYERVDIGLDPFPYHGTTTTCEALWMGVPVITLAGQSHVSRVGVSLMSAVGLRNCIGETPEQYVERAAQLAAEIGRLNEFRQGMRERMRRSPLMDGPQFARNVEEAYREMWKTYCAATPSP